MPAAAIGLALRRLDTQVQQQALLDGVCGASRSASSLRPARRVAAIVAVLAVQEFAVYEPTGISVVATEVRMVFETGAFSSPDNPITAPMGGARRWHRRIADGLAADQRTRRGGGGGVAAACSLVIALLRDPAAPRRAAARRRPKRSTPAPGPRALDAPVGVTLVAVARRHRRARRAARVARPLASRPVRARATSGRSSRRRFPGRSCCRRVTGVVVARGWRCGVAVRSELPWPLMRRRWSRS